MEGRMVDNKKSMPKGGSKGGTRFPRLSLKKAHDYAKKLVSKTHTGAQPSEIILPGVFGNAGPSGQVRASALKQYTLLEGTPKAYSASKLAQELNGSTPEELGNYLKQVFLKPKLFKTLFDTFCDDTASRAKIRQQASNLNVHPDSLDECVQVFIESAVYAGFATENGDSIEMHASPTPQEPDGDADSVQQEDETEAESMSEDISDDEKQDTKNKNENTSLQENLTSTKSNIDIKIDPSMDPEKLDKLLAVLKKYGQI